MPNNITNYIKILGCQDQIDQVKDFLRSEEIENTELSTIDFNKITLMPPWVYNGNLGIEEEKKYGSENCWHDWACKNWGTKWNAYSQPDLRSVDNLIYFTTAWNNVGNLIKKLSWIFPDIEFEYGWASEDHGHNLGIINLKDGIILSKNIPTEYNRESRKLACEIKKHTASDHYLNENYDYKE